MQNFWIYVCSYLCQGCFHPSLFFVDYPKSREQISTKLGGRMWYGSGKKHLYFGADSEQGSYRAGFFFTFFNFLEIGCFSTFLTFTQETIHWPWWNPIWPIKGSDIHECVKFDKAQINLGCWGGGCWTTEKALKSQQIKVWTKEDEMVNTRWDEENNFN